MAVLPPPAPGCASCAARDAVIGEQARVLEEQAAAIGDCGPTWWRWRRLLVKGMRVPERDARVPALIGAPAAGPES